MTTSIHPQFAKDHNAMRRDSLTWALGIFLMAPHTSALSAPLHELSSDGIELVFPSLADTGNAVPLEAQITAPSGLHLRALKVILPENPNPVALHLKIMGQPLQYKLKTRLRLAASQSVWLVAVFNDGSERANHAPTVITSTACLDDS
jgi:sulfur-oxidizing protein SoxY